MSWARKLPSARLQSLCETAFDVRNCRLRWRRDHAEEHHHDRRYGRGKLRSRGVSKLSNSPFLKVEASKFTEVGMSGATWNR
jgi:hypothetical protein